MNAAATLAMSVFLIPVVASAAPEPEIPAAPAPAPETSEPEAPEAPAPAASPEAEIPPAAPERHPLERRAAIPSSGRGLVHHTALTVPKGTVDVSARGALPLGALVMIAGGIGERTELSAEVGVANENEDAAAVVGAGFKQVIARSRRVQLSLGGSVRHLRDTGASLSLGQLGGTLTACTDEACSLMFSLGLSGLYVREEDDVRTVVSVGFSGGQPHLRFLGEVVVVAGTELVLGGMRFGNAKFAADLGVASPIVSDGDAMPFAGFAVRM